MRSANTRPGLFRPKPRRCLPLHGARFKRAGGPFGFGVQQPLLLKTGVGVLNEDKDHGHGARHQGTPHQPTPAEGGRMHAGPNPSAQQQGNHGHFAAAQPSGPQQNRGSHPTPAPQYFLLGHRHQGQEGVQRPIDVLVAHSAKGTRRGHPRCRVGICGVQGGKLVPPKARGLRGNQPQNAQGYPQEPAANANRCGPRLQCRNHQNPGQKAQNRGPAPVPKGPHEGHQKGRPERPKRAGQGKRRAKKTRQSPQDQGHQGRGGSGVPPGQETGVQGQQNNGNAGGGVSGRPEHTNV